MSFAPILVELHSFFFPLRRALKNGDNLSEFLAYFGYGLNPAASGAALSDLSSLSDAVTTISDLIDSIVAVAADGVLDISAAEQANIIANATTVFEAVDDIIPLVTAVFGSPPDAEFPMELFDRLIDLYLENRAPPVQQIFAALDVRQSTPKMRNISYDEVRYNFSRLSQFIGNTGQWADEVYGWNRNFDHLRAVLAVSKLVDTFGGKSYIHPISDLARAAFVQNPPTIVLPAVLPDGIVAGSNTAPVIQSNLPFYAIEKNGVYAEAGVTVAPTGDFNQPAQMGLAIAPYVEGQATGTIPINDRLSFSFEVTGAATGGAFITVRPSGVASILGGASSASYSAILAYKKPDSSPIVFLGNADGTRIQADALLASTGGSMDGDLYIAGGVRGLTAVIDPGDDGLLSALIPDPIIVKAGDILLGVRPGRGVYFESGSSLSVDIPLNIDLSLLKILGMGIKLDWSDNFAIDTTLEGELKIGPLYAYADGIGIRTKIVKRKGMLGENDLEFGFIPPTTYAVSLDLAPIEGGGLIELGDKEYRGALALKFQMIGFSAFGILNTELPGGRPGFSFVASIFGEFSLPLGFGFFLTGLGGVVGINRTIDTNAMREVLFEGRFDNLLFPADPIANAATILDDMAAIFPSREGQHVFGPVARIGWGVPTLIAVKLGVVIEVGSQIRLLILGGLTCELPTADAAIISLKLSFFGEIDFNGGTISFDATLQGSRILTFALSGDVAVRTGWASGIEHIVSFGGLHPQFPRPANLPDLRRISLDFGTNNPRITVSGYTAITLNSLQFGAELQLYAKGPKIWLIGQLAAEGWAYFHALVIFDPFAFSANLGGGIKLLRNGKIVCGLGFDITLTGPNRFTIDGRVWVSVLGIDVDFNIKHSWGSDRSLPPVIVDPALVLRAALEGTKIEPVTSQGGGTVQFVKIDAALSVLDPVGGARINQNRLPLGTRISRIGEGTIPGGATADIRLSRNGQPLAAIEQVTSDFVHGHYFDTSQAEKLRATAYDRLKSGVVVAKAAIDCDGNRAVAVVQEYEIVPIPIADERETATVPGLGQLFLRTDLLERARMTSRYSSLAEAFAIESKVQMVDAPVVNPIHSTVESEVESAIRGAGAGIAQDALFESFAEAGNALAVEADALALSSGDVRAGIGAKAIGPVPSYFAMAA
jgi:hypothetical protein